MRKRGQSTRKRTGQPNQQQSQSETVDNILKGATKVQKLAYKDLEDEHKRRGYFKRIFPTPEYAYYKQFFEESRPLNDFLDLKMFELARKNQSAREKSNIMPAFMG